MTYSWDFWLTRQLFACSSSHLVNHFETDFIHLYTLSWSAYKKADGELALGGKKEAPPAATFVVVHAGGTAGLPAPPVLSMSRAALSTKRITQLEQWFLTWTWTVSEVLQRAQAHSAALGSRETPLLSVSCSQHTSSRLLKRDVLEILWNNKDLTPVRFNTCSQALW